jgi:glycosyltransferase involved in cell wall biosynthesis
VRTATRLLLDALARAGADVSALAPRPVDLPPGVTMRATGGPLSPRRWRRSRALRRALGALDLFHSPVTAFPRFRGPKVSVTVHELPFVENFRLEGWRRALAQQVWLARAMGECARIFAPTAATLRQMTLVHAACPEVTSVVPHPCPPIPAGVRSDDGSILFVGRLDRRKCVEALLAGVVGRAGEIRLAGPHGWSARRRIERAAAALGVRPRFLGVVPDGELDRLYRCARAVGLLSVSEGFGFPVLEALGRGVPVVVARGTGAAEVGGGSVLAVDPIDRAAIAAAFDRAGEDSYRVGIARSGPARAAEFTAARTAQGYQEGFRLALGG